MGLLIAQTICLMVALYLTCSVVFFTWVYASWVSNSNVKQFKYNATGLTTAASIAWGIFYFLCKM